MSDPARAFVIGQPIAHSRSPLIHGHWLSEFGIPGSYERIEVAPADVAAFLDGFSAQGFAGGNVTVPHKEAAFRAVDDPTPQARRLGAVNTLWRDGAGRLVGDNTDAHGFAAGLDQAVEGWAGATPAALVLGAGGAARAIVSALVDRGIHRIAVANRTEARSRDLCHLAPDRIDILPWDGVESALGGIGLLVNTTQLGMAGQPPLAIGLDRLPADAIVADIVYVPLETPLLAAARARGLRTADGLGMLLHQAVPGFARWFGRTPRVTPDLRALIEADIRRGA